MCALSIIFAIKNTCDPWSKAFLDVGFNEVILLKERENRITKARGKDF